jgi:hypothetical protein
MGAQATICIVNHRTLDFTRLCLRCVRKFTRVPCEVLVIDNDSQDESLDYLRGLHWIRLIERSTESDPDGGHSHAAALDLGLQNCRTEFFVSMHSDAFVLGPGWLTDLMGYFDGDPQIACVGSGKIELTPAWRTALKRCTDLRAFMRKLMRPGDPLGVRRHYNRTICCLYRADILRREGLSFLLDREKGMTSGKKLYFELVDRGYRTVELPVRVMARYVVHLAHATQVVNPQEFALRSKTVRKCNRLTRRVLSSATMQAILADTSLDEGREGH